MLCVGNSRWCYERELGGAGLAFYSSSRPSLLVEFQSQSDYDSTRSRCVSSSRQILMEARSISMILNCSTLTSKFPWAGSRISLSSSGESLSRDLTAPYVAKVVRAPRRHCGMTSQMGHLVIDVLIDRDFYLL